ncbi:hypothetical protein FSP39_016280 [Pinctada imbricata]|uniref:G-protein coupled receptors family 1 profile domain-containing protein n=1 Tax=Pinctada imbricata TaxID=66713 RepID=A0AA88XPI6_PINIB|nr:hypothetical protein FSP39_016280 [Pinctada imbricata]
MDLKSIFKILEGRENITHLSDIQHILAPAILLNISNSSVPANTDSPTGALIFLFGAPSLLFLGTLGNSLSLVVMKKFASKLSTYIYLFVLAFVDLFVLYIGLLPKWIQTILEENIFSTSTIICKAGNFGGYFGSHFSVWLIVVVIFERFLTVQSPRRAVRICKVRTALYIIIVLASLLIILNSHIFWTVGIEYDEASDTKSCQASGNLSRIFPWVDGVVYFAGPFLVITILVVIMVFAVCRRQEPKPVCAHGGARKFTVDDRRHLVSRKNKRLTLMLLAVSVTYLLTTLPMVIILIYYTFQQVTSAESFRKTESIRIIAELLMYTNHAIRFILYLAVGKEFRKRFKMLVCLKDKSESLRFDARTRTFSFSQNGRQTRSTFITTNIPLEN